MNPVLLFQDQKMTRIQDEASARTGDACVQHHFVCIVDFTVADEMGSPLALKVEELLLNHKLCPLNSDNPLFQRGGFYASPATIVLDLATRNPC